jgi:hypothetical protein
MRFFPDCRTVWWQRPKQDQERNSPALATYNSTAFTYQ